ncbi:MAG: sulfurtransferase [Tepidimonas sp.]|uniref:sulfurtransferase n=1 Tax=Tepidimonas sp. TaxID=2002775 RepID=UPI004054EB89
MKWLTTWLKNVGAALTASLLGLSAWAQTALPGPVVSTQWLADHLDKVQVVEVRRDPKTFTSAPELATAKDGKKTLEEFGGHIPGSRLFLAKELQSEREIRGVKVKYLLPERDAFERAAQAAGIDADRPIVLVPEGLSIGDVETTTRLAMLLKSYSDTPMALLDGGMVAWLLEGRPWSTDAAPAKTGTWRATVDRFARYVVDSPQVASAAEKKDVQLLDARPAGMHLGVFKRDYVYAYGHIAGSRNVPLDTLYVTKGSTIRLLPAASYRALFQTYGIDPAKPTITYCNSGNNSSLAWFVMSEILGNAQVSNYDGSLHQWTLEKRPLQAPVPPAM